MADRRIRKALLVLALLALAGGAARALDYFPHVEAVGGAGCIADCHATRDYLDQMLQSQYEHEPQYPGDTPVTMLCTARCHNDVLGPYVETHASRSFPGSAKAPWIRTSFNSSSQAGQAGTIVTPNGHYDGQSEMTLRQHSLRVAAS
jgi:hypothetical protein